MSLLLKAMSPSETEAMIGTATREHRQGPGIPTSEALFSPSDSTSPQATEPLRPPSGALHLHPAVIIKKRQNDYCPRVFSPCLVELKIKKCKNSYHKNNTIVQTHISR